MTFVHIYPCFSLLKSSQCQDWVWLPSWCHRPVPGFAWAKVPGDCSLLPLRPWASDQETSLAFSSYAWMHHDEYGRWGSRKWTKITQWSKTGFKRDIQSDSRCRGPLHKCIIADWGRCFRAKAVQTCSLWVSRRFMEFLWIFHSLIWQTEDSWPKGWHQVLRVGERKGLTVIL